MEKYKRWWFYVAIVAAGAVLFVVHGDAALAKTAAAVEAVQWQKCPDFEVPTGKLECGQLKVPLDYTKPNGEKISVAVSRLKAINPQLRRGVLLLNPGGPGGQGIDMPLWMAEIMPQSVLDTYDLIGFDPRGVGYSTPVTCGLTAEESLEIAPPLMQGGSFDKTAAFMKKVADGCAAKSGSHLPYITTANTARDMDKLRQALGEPKISYFGYSYGTYLGAVYASLYPAAADRFVLDSATNARAAWRELFRSWGLADTSRFPDFAQFLIDNESTYHLGKTQEEVRQTYFQLMRKVKDDPISFPDGMVLSDTWLRVLTFAGLYSDFNFGDTADVWSLVKDQQPSAKLQQLVAHLQPLAAFPGVPADNSGAATNAVLCDDSLWSRQPWQYQVELGVDSFLHPMFGELGSNIWPCAYWHTTPVETPVAITPSGPAKKVMVVQNQRDPATPYANGREMRLALGDRARLVSVVQGGHGASYGERNACAQQTVTNYLVDGVFPANDMTCRAEVPHSKSSPLSSSAANAMRELRRRMW